MVATQVEAKIYVEQKQKQLEKGTILDVIDAAISRAIMSKKEAELIVTAEKSQFAVISVDDFGHEQLGNDSVKM